MKTIILQLWQWVLKHRKKIIYGALALFVLQICFFDIGGIGIQNVAQAAETASQSESFENIVSKKVSLLAFIKTAIYVLIYPLLFLAGRLVDNSFVYGEVFGFDAVLWNLWNFVKNLANFGLGFIFVYKIFEYLIKGQKAGDMKKLLVSSLIAGIGIQASWFLMAALIDVSTILTYGVGGLPISVLGDEMNSDDSGEDSQEGFNPYVFKTLISVDTDDNVSDLNIYLTNISAGDPIYISECRTFPYKKAGSGDEKNIEETLILAPRMMYYYKDDQHIYPTMDKTCHYYGQIYWFDGLVPDIQKNRSQSATDIQGWKDAKNKYDEAVTNYISKTLSGVNISDVEGCHVLEVGNAHETGGIWSSESFGVVLTGEKCGWDADNKWIGSGATIQFKDLMSSNGTNSYVGVFTSLYSSLLNAGSTIMQNANSGIYEKFLAIILSLGHIIAIAIPLVAVVVVFVMRIGIIWVAIALSPMIVLLSAFGLFDKITKSVKFFEYLDLKNLIGIIFAPAAICFAISMSTVLVKVIEKINTSKISTEPLVLGGLVEVNLAGFTVGLGQLIIAVMGIAITWFLVWTAIKSSKLGEKGGLVDSLYNLATSAIGSVPIVPIPGKDGKGVDFIGASTAFGLNGQQGIINSAVNKVVTKYNDESTDTLEQRLDPNQAQTKAQSKVESNIFQGYSNWIKTAQISGDWTSQSTTIGDDTVTFNSLSDAYKDEIIKQINELQEETRKNFGQVKTVTVGNKTYTYDDQSHKYK